MKHITVVVLLFLLTPMLPAQEAATPLPQVTVTASPTIGFSPAVGFDELASLPLSLYSPNIDGRHRIKDALAMTPGVFTHTGNGVHDYFVIRGIDSLTGANILIDGFPEPEATIYPMHHIDRVQVLRGPMGAYLGAGSLAGSVNLIRKPILDHTHASGTTEAGSFGHFRQEVDAGTQHFRFNGLYDTGDGYRDDMDHDLWSFNGSLRLFRNEATTALLHLDVLDSEYTPDAGLPVLGTDVIDVDPETSFQSPDDFSEQQVVRLALDVEHALDSDWILRSRTTYTDFEWDSKGVVFGSFVKFGAGLEEVPRSLARIQPQLDDEQTLIGEEITLQREFDHHDLTLGGFYRFYADEFTLTLDPTTDIDVFTRETSPGLLEPLPTNVGDAEVDWFSLYALDRMRIDEKLSLLGGLRASWLDFEDSAQGTSRDDENLSGSIGASYQLTDRITAFANVGTGFAPPSTQTQGERGKPEESVQGEIGLRWQAGHYEAALSGYQIERDNIAIPDSTGVQASNGEQISQGIELEARIHPTEDVQLIAGYAYLDSELDRFTELTQAGFNDYSGNTAAFSPEHSALLQANLLLTENWMLGAGLRYVDEQFIAPDNGFVIDDYVVAHASLGYQADAWGVSVRVDNLTDEEYYGRGAGSTSVRPEDGTAVTVRLNYDF